MLLFLSGVYSTKDAPNENYGRELMELFTLGEGRGYTERDVRQQARALTGWTADYKDPIGFYKFRFEPSYHDKGTKTIFGRRGKFDWKDACRLCLENRAHGSFFVRKLWSYFIPTQIPATTERELIKLYRKQGYAIRPVVEAILRHPHLYTGPTMMNPPVVYTAGLMRALGRRITTSEWFIYALGTGQLLFYPPNVAGWKDDRWLDTATFRGRWNLTAFALHPGTLDPEKKAGTLPTDPGKVVSAALKSAGSPPLQKATLDLLLEFARRALEDAEDEYEQAVHPVLVYNAVRQLALVCPDYQAA
jgi:uncharacterized protein (DUF1800 family)